MGVWNEVTGHGLELKALGGFWRVGWLKMTLRVQNWVERGWAFFYFSFLFNYFLFVCKLFCALKCFIFLAQKPAKVMLLIKDVSSGGSAAFCTLHIFRAEISCCPRSRI